MSNHTIGVRAVVLHAECAPAYANPGDGAFDLRARIPAPMWLNPGERRVIPTGLMLAVPEGYAGFVLPRSGNAKTWGVAVANSPGLIDSGYRGEVCVILENRGDQAFALDQYDRFAQFAIVPVMTAKFEFVDTLDTTARAGGGFGSSGRK